MADIAVRILTATLTIGAAIAVTQQCRRPRWLPGRLFVWIMNRSHLALTTWALEHIEIPANATVLDIGCGGGRTIQTLAGIARDGRVYGVDYSRQSVAAARRTNAAAIAAGRVEILEASVSRLPHPDGMFDVVTAIETFYYWPNPVADLREVRRVMKPGGQLLIVAEAYRGGQLDALNRPAMALLRAKYLTPDEHEQVLREAGFADVKIFTKPGGSWLCALATTSVGIRS